jgi:hypothetical protein
MGVVEDVRQVLQDFIAPELREIRGQIAALGQRIDAAEEVNRLRYETLEQRLEQRFAASEDVSRARHENILQRLDLIQQSFAFDKRISDLEAEKRRSA